MRAKAKQVTEIRDARTKTIDFTDPEKEGEKVRFIRTALVVEGGGPVGVSIDEGGSIDLVRIIDGKPVRIGQINIHLLLEEGKEVLMVDVIDTEGRYKNHRALGFTKGGRTVAETESLVGAHFE